MSFVKHLYTQKYKYFKFIFDFHKTPMPIKYVNIEKKNNSVAQQEMMNLIKTCNYHPLIVDFEIRSNLMKKNEKMNQDKNE